ncbi:MAG: ATP-binding protein [Candidatus Onthomonas sp.]
MSETLFSVLTIVTEGLLRWLTCLIYLWPLPRQRRFGLRAGAVLALSMGLEWVLQVSIPSVVYEVLTPVLLLAFGFAVGKLCWRTEMGTALYLAVWAVISYLLVYEVWELLCFYKLPIYRYGRELQWGLRLALTAAVYLPLGLTVGRWMSVYISRHVGPRQTASAVLLYAFFAALMSNYYIEGVFLPQRMTGLLVLISQAYTITILYLQTALFRKSAMQQELDTMNLLWHQQKAQYQVAKETIDVINRKCHDLKHQVAAMRTMESSERREQYLREIEDSVHIYDSMIKTGNETLDTVLTEKSLLCEASRITVNCVADGAQMDFMDPVDLYTILGNALDNAMEAVRAFEEEEMRIIDVLIHVRQRFLVINVTNPLKGPLTFREGLPVSKKPKDGYHGYGMRSIRHTVHKYGGEMAVEAENGSFSLRLMIPLPEQLESPSFG